MGFPSYLINNGLSRMPSIEFGNAYTNIFDQCCVDTHFTHTLITYSSALSWVKGAHSLKFGGEQRLFLTISGNRQIPPACSVSTRTPPTCRLTTAW